MYTKWETVCPSQTGQDNIGMQHFNTKVVCIYYERVNSQLVGNNQ